MNIKPHLQKYVVDQNYKKYTSEDQAIWRYIMKRITNNLSLYGCKGSLSGMKKTGITFDRIPRIEDIDQKLQEYGWRAAPVSGFIPPLAFMDFQLNQILPIASELRTLQHIYYTPAPDIVHESVGHIPFLIEPIFSQFLKEYAQTVKKAIFNKEDIKQYEAIRKLSDLKEDPRSTTQQIQEAERHLKQITKKKTQVSESSALSRFIWWTSEYGLIREGLDIKIFGAGLISSLGETKYSMSSKVKKISLTEDCLNYDYDITSFQPQLFVAESFQHLLEVLNKISNNLSWKQGGWSGVQKALSSQTMNTIELDSGLQISGIMENQKSQEQDVYFLKFKGPCQLSYKNKELPHHGKKTHSQGYSTPLGLLKNSSKPLYEWTEQELREVGIKKEHKAHLCFASGMELKGELIRELREDGKLLVLTFKNCLVQQGSHILFEPSWGEFDLGIGQSVVSVFSGPADKQAYGHTDDQFQPSQITPRVYSQKEKEVFKIHEEIAELKSSEKGLKKEKIQRLLNQIQNHSDALWLVGLELLEQAKEFPDVKNQINLYLESLEKKESSLRAYLQDGKALYS